MVPAHAWHGRRRDRHQALGAGARTDRPPARGHRSRGTHRRRCGRHRDRRGRGDRGAPLPARRARRRRNGHRRRRRADPLRARAARRALDRPLGAGAAARAALRPAVGRGRVRRGRAAVRPGGADRAGRGRRQAGRLRSGRRPGADRGGGGQGVRGAAAVLVQPEALRRPGGRDRLRRHHRRRIRVQREHPVLRTHRRGERCRPRLHRDLHRPRHLLPVRPPALSPPAPGTRSARPRSGEERASASSPT